MCRAILGPDLARLLPLFSAKFCIDQVSTHKVARPLSIDYLCTCIPARRSASRTLVARRQKGLRAPALQMRL